MKAFIETVCWLIAGVLLWLLTVSTITVAELAIAAATSAACGVFATAARRVTGLRVRPTLDWLRWTALVPMQAVTDTGRLVGWLARGAHDESPADATTERHVAAADAAATVGTRTAAIGAISATPGSLVMDIDDEGRMLVHEIVGGWPNLTERVAQ